MRRTTFDVAGAGSNDEFRLLQQTGYRVVHFCTMASRIFEPLQDTVYLGGREEEHCELAEANSRWGEALDDARLAIPLGEEITMKRVVAVLLVLGRIKPLDPEGPLFELLTDHPDANLGDKPEDGLVGKLRMLMGMVGKKQGPEAWNFLLTNFCEAFDGALLRPEDEISTGLRFSYRTSPLQVIHTAALTPKMMSIMLESVEPTAYITEGGDVVLRVPSGEEVWRASLHRLLEFGFEFDAETQCFRFKVNSPQRREACEHFLGAFFACEEDVEVWKDEEENEGLTICIIE